MINSFAYCLCVSSNTLKRRKDRDTRSTVSSSVLIHNKKKLVEALIKLTLYYPNGSVININNNLCHYFNTDQAV